MGGLFKSKSLLSSVSNLLRKVLKKFWIFIVLYHFVFLFFPLPETFRYKDLYTVGNNAVSMAFFAGTMVLAH